MIGNQTHTFERGLDQDTAKNAVLPNSITDANDIEFLDKDASRQFIAQPWRSTKLAYEIPSAEQQPQMDRLEWFGSGTYGFQIYDQDNNPLFPFVLSGSFATINDLQTQIGIAVALYGFSASWQPLSGDFYTLSLTRNPNATPFVYTLRYTFNGDNKTTYTIQDAILKDTELIPLAAWNIQDVDIVFSGGVSTICDEIGIAKKSNGIWDYTRLLRTNKYGFSDNYVFSIRMESQSNSFYGIYWTEGIHGMNKPKTLYFPQEYFTDCVLKWTPSSYNTPSTVGYYTLGSLNSTTNLQLANNTGRVEYFDQRQGGGALIAGGYRYAVRFGISGTENTTGWSYLSQLIPVFKTSTESPSAYPNIQGDIPGEQTGKINILEVRGAQSSTYDFCELAAVYYSGIGEVATEAYIVNRFKFSQDVFTVTHSGRETNTQTLDVNTLVDVTEIILKSGELEIKKNRLNLANNTVTISDPEFVDILGANNEGIGIAYGKKELQSVGKLNQISNTLVVRAQYDSTHTQDFGVNNQIIFPVVLQDTNSEYNNTTGVFTVLTPNIFSITYDFNLFFAMFNSDQRVQRCDITLFKNGSPIKIGTVYANDITSGGFIRNSKELFNDTNFPCVQNDTFELRSRFYGGGVDNANIQINSTISYLNIAYANSNNLADFTQTRAAEYQLPENVAKYTGYMFNDTYVFYAKMHMTDESITKPYFIGSQSFNDTYDTNIYTDNNTFNDIKVYAYHAIINHIPIAALRNKGVKGISIWRAIVNPTILGSGIILPSDIVIGGDFSCGYYAGIPFTNGQYGTEVSSADDRRKDAFFISADTRISKAQYNTADRLISFGQATVEQNSFINGYGVVGDNGDNITCNGSYAQYTGFRLIPGLDVYDLTDSAYVEFDSTATNAFPNPNYRASTVFGRFNGGASATETLSLQSTARINLQAGSAPDNGIYMGQYQRQVAQQYDIENVTVIPTGTFIEITEDTPDILDGIEVFGGDTYTQKSIVKLMYGNADRVSLGRVRYSFVSYYSQNRVNTQLFYTDKIQPKDTWNLGATGAVVNYLFPTVVSDANPQEQFNHSEVYIAPNILNTDTPFIINQLQNSKFPTRIWYSEQKPTGSIFDFYRQILPLSFKDLDAKNGPITGLYDINDVMMAWQPNAVSVLPYQSDVALNAGSAEVYLGNGGVYAQRESIVSLFGASISTGILRIENDNGHQAIAWYSDLFKKLMYYGTQGAECISEQKKMRSFFLNNTDWISQDWDIILGYDIEYNRLFITSRAYNRNIANWDNETNYNTGDYVNYEIADQSATFEVLPNIYRALSYNINQSPYQNDNWEFIPIADTTYYNFWTLCYNTKWGSFSTKGTILPRRYFFYENILLSPRPKSSWGRIYELNQGDDFLQYFQQDEDFKPGEFILEITTNEIGVEPKRYIAIAMIVGEDHTNNPTIEVYNNYQNTSMAPDTMELRRENLVVNVREDEQDRPLISDWASFRIRNTSFMKIFSVITTFYNKKRSTRK